MPNSKAKENGEKIALVVKAWEDLRSTKSFAGMTLDEFKLAIKPSLDARAAIGTLENQLITANDDRDDADVVSLEKVALVVAAVKGDITEGEDSDLYEAFGYIRKSERKSGLTKKTKPTPPAPTP